MRVWFPFRNGVCLAPIAKYFGNLGAILAIAAAATSLNFSELAKFFSKRVFREDKEFKRQ